MISKEQIAKIIRDETWVEVDSAIVYGVNEAAEKVLQAVEAAEQSVQSDGACPSCQQERVYVCLNLTCPECIIRPPRRSR